MDSQDIETDITLHDKRWNNAISNIDAYTRKIIHKALSNKLNNIKAAGISIVLADDTFIRELNKSYRGKDAPTNVLSFPMSEPEELESSITAAPPPFCILGDIIISYDTISREATEQRKHLPNHFAHMLVHGCLHLLHYDHQSNHEAKAMEKLEIDILEQLGVKNPYES